MLDVQAAARFMFKCARNEDDRRMAELDEPAEEENDALARLEAALERIALHAKPNPNPPTEAAVIAARLDTLIAQLRSALATAEA
jgi:hypothetical protein